MELQEILYPEFCSILVRFACARYSMLPGLANRVEKLVVDGLLPLLEQHTETPMHALEEDAAFCQYLQLIDPVMKIIFAAAAKKIIVRTWQVAWKLVNTAMSLSLGENLLQEADKDRAASVMDNISDADRIPSDAMVFTGGLVVGPDPRTLSLSTLQAAVVVPHVLDMTPVDPSHCCTLSVRQLLYLLQHCGIVGKPVANRCISHADAVGAIQRACYPSSCKHALVSQEPPILRDS